MKARGLPNEEKLGVLRPLARHSIMPGAMKLATAATSYLLVKLR